MASHPMTVWITLEYAEGGEVALKAQVPGNLHVETLRVQVDGAPLAVLPFTLHGHPLRFDQAQGHTHDDDDERG